MTTLTFRTTRRQLRGLAIFTAVLAGLTALCGLIAAQSASGFGGGVAPWFVGCASGAVVGGYCLVVYATVFTECTPEALRTRTLNGRLHVLPWPQVADLTVRAMSARGNTTYRVMVTPATGKRFALGAPVSGGVMGDAQFADKVQQIQEYWRAATGSAVPGTAEPSSYGATAHAAARGIGFDARPVTAARVMRRITVAVFMIIPVFFIAAAAGNIGPAWAAHLGDGERGTFTAYASDCSQRPCTWYGTFTGRDGVSTNGLHLAGGENVSHIGQVVPAIDVGSGNGEVYPGNGGPAWLTNSLLMAAGVVFLCADLLYLARSLRRRAARRRALVA